MASPYRGTPTALDTRDAWIPVASLPPDVRARLTSLGEGEPCESAAMRRGATPHGLLVLAAALCVVALLALTQSPPSPPFAQVTRWLPLLVGAVAAATTGGVFLLRRRGWWAPSRFHLGPTTLLTVQSGHLRVMPAERVEATSERVLFDGDTLDEGFHDPTWLAALGARTSLARADADARRDDPWRALPALVPPVSGRTARTARALRVAAAAFVGLAAGAFIEAVPLGVPGARLARATQARRDAEARRRAAAAREAATVAAAQAREAAATRERLQRAALTGGEEDARAWLRQRSVVDDEALVARVEARLAAFCAAHAPDAARVPEHLQTYLRLRQGACGDADWRLYYLPDECHPRAAEALLTRRLQEVSALLGERPRVHPYVIAAPDGRHPYLRASASRDAPRVDDAEVATSGVTAPFEVWQCDGEVTPARRVWLTLAPFDRNGGRLPIRARVEPVDFRVGGE